MLLTHFGLAPPRAASIRVLDRQTQHGVRFLLPQTPPPPRLANACVNHAAIQAFRQRSCISIWKAVFNELLEMSVFLRHGCLGVFVGGIRGFLWRLPVNAIASAIKGDDILRLVTSQSTEVHVITQDLGLYLFFQVSWGSLSFSMVNIFYAEHVLWTAFSQGSNTTEECETLLKKAVVRNSAVNFIISVTFNIFWWCSCVRDKCCVSPRTGIHVSYMLSYTF